MSTAKSNTRMYAMLALVFLVVTILMIAFLSEWFWLALPFLLTFTVKAFNVI